MPRTFWDVTYARTNSMHLFNFGVLWHLRTFCLVVHPNQLIILSKLDLVFLQSLMCKERNISSWMIYSVWQNIMSILYRKYQQETNDTTIQNVIKNDIIQRKPFVLNMSMTLSFVRRFRIKTSAHDLVLQWSSQLENCHFLKREKFFNDTHSGYQSFWSISTSILCPKSSGLQKKHICPSFHVLVKGWLYLFKISKQG